MKLSTDSAQVNPSSLLPLPVGSTLGGNTMSAFIAKRALLNSVDMAALKAYPAGKPVTLHVGIEHGHSEGECHLELGECLRDGFLSLTAPRGHFWNQVKNYVDGPTIAKKVTVGVLELLKLAPGEIVELSFVEEVEEVKVSTVYGPEHGDFWVGKPVEQVTQAHEPAHLLLAVGTFKAGIYGFVPSTRHAPIVLERDLHARVQVKTGVLDKVAWKTCKVAPGWGNERYTFACAPSEIVDYLNARGEAKGNPARVSVYSEDGAKVVLQVDGYVIEKGGKPADLVGASLWSALEGFGTPPVEVAAPVPKPLEADIRASVSSQWQAFEVAYKHDGLEAAVTQSALKQLNAGIKFARKEGITEVVEYYTVRRDAIFAEDEARFAVVEYEDAPTVPVVAAEAAEVVLPTPDALDALATELYSTPRHLRADFGALTFTGFNMRYGVGAYDRVEAALRAPTPEPVEVVEAVAVPAVPTEEVAVPVTVKVSPMRKQVQGLMEELEALTGQPVTLEPHSLEVGWHILRHGLDTEDVWSGCTGEDGRLYIVGRISQIRDQLRKYIKHVKKLVTPEPVTPPAPLQVVEPVDVLPVPVAASPVPCEVVFRNNQRVSVTKDWSMNPSMSTPRVKTLAGVIVRTDETNDGQPMYTVQLDDGGRYTTVLANVLTPVEVEPAPCATPVLTFAALLTVYMASDTVTPEEFGLALHGAALEVTSPGGGSWAALEPVFARLEAAAPRSAWLPLPSAADIGAVLDDVLGAVAAEVVTVPGKPVVLPPSAKSVRLSKALRRRAADSLPLPTPWRARRALHAPLGSGLHPLPGRAGSGSVASRLTGSGLPVGMSVPLPGRASPAGVGLRDGLIPYGVLPEGLTGPCGARAGGLSYRGESPRGGGSGPSTGSLAYGMLPSGAAGCSGFALGSGRGLALRFTRSGPGPPCKVGAESRVYVKSDLRVDSRKYVKSDPQSWRSFSESCEERFAKP